MRRIGICFALTMLAGGCGDETPPGEVPGPTARAPETPADAAERAERGPGARAPAAGRAGRDDRLAALAGTWHGGEDTEAHGPVRAELEVLSGGVVVYTVVGQGRALSGHLFIERWDGRRLRVRAPTGTHDIPARLEGEVLMLELPGAGAVRLARQASAR